MDKLNKASKEDVIKPVQFTNVDTQYLITKAILLINEQCYIFSMDFCLLLLAKQSSYIQILIYFEQVHQDVSMILYLLDCSLLKALKVSFLCQGGQCINW